MYNSGSLSSLCKQPSLFAAQTVHQLACLCIGLDRHAQHLSSVGVSRIVRCLAVLDVAAMVCIRTQHNGEALMESTARSGVMLM